MSSQHPLFTLVPSIEPKKTAFEEQQQQMHKAAVSALWQHWAKRQESSQKAQRTQTAYAIVEAAKQKALEAQRRQEGAQEGAEETADRDVSEETADRDVSEETADRDVPEETADRDVSEAEKESLRNLKVYDAGRKAAWSTGDESAIRSAEKGYQQALEDFRAHRDRRLKEGGEIFKYGIEDYLKGRTKLDSLEKDTQIYNRIEKLIPELDSTLLRRIFINKNGEASFGRVKGLSKSAKEFLTLVTELHHSLKDTYGAKVTDFDLATFMRKLPNIQDSPEAMKGALKQLRAIADITKARIQARQNAYRKLGYGADPARIDELTEKYYQPMAKALAKRVQDGPIDLKVNENYHPSSQEKSASLFGPVEPGTKPSSAHLQEYLKWAGGDARKAAEKMDEHGFK